MGSEQLDGGVDTWAALQALEHLAVGKQDHAMATWARDTYKRMEESFDAAWWMPGESLYADSRCNGDDCVAEKDRQKKGWTNVCDEADQPLQQRVWIAVKP